jgi:hypothetical protein
VDGQGQPKKKRGSWSGGIRGYSPTRGWSS